MVTAVNSRLRTIPSNNGVSQYLASLRDNKVPRNEIFTNTAPVQDFLDEDFTRDIIPRQCHSHNDYLRDVPWYDALNAGCSSIEADIWIDINDNINLLVGRTMKALGSART